MKLLVVTQKVDQRDANLGFFHTWLAKLAERVDRLIIICLEKGMHTLPPNVTVLSLGKEDKLLRTHWLKRLVYFLRFRRFIREYVNEYDGVVVHMNAEYVVLGSKFWRRSGKKTLFWYTHKAVNWWVRRAERRADAIFTASPESFRIPSAKTHVVGHGIDVDAFAGSLSHAGEVTEIKALSIGRIAPTKDIETIIKAVAMFREQHSEVPISLTIIGEPITPADRRYQESLIQLVAHLGLTDLVVWRGGISHAAVAGEYAKHTALLHTSMTGSLDKVVLEALAGGLPVLTSSEAYGPAVVRGVVYTFPPHDFRALTRSLENLYRSGKLKRNPEAAQFVREYHNLYAVLDKIIAFLKPEYARHL